MISLNQFPCDCIWDTTSKTFKEESLKNQFVKETYL